MFDAADGRKTRATVLTEVTIPSITLEMAKSAIFIKCVKENGFLMPDATKSRDRGPFGTHWAPLC
jgi:hypothetical protein